jgi:Histidine kinase-, DNA gyrase B-, and HSP90-like ATPase
MYPLTSFVGATWAFITSYRSRYGPLKLQPSRQLAWLLVSLGILVNGLGSIYFTYMVRTGQAVLVPSLADVGFTLFYPLVFFGIFLMPASLKFRNGIASVNALKYSPPTTPIAFSARIVNFPVPGVIVSVIDRGKGISEQGKDRLFQRFVRLDQDLNSSVRGSGLGLYISHRLVEAMDGKIWVESKGVPGEGSQFNVQLPITI